MKIWRGHGTEHSMNLVMIGHFQDAVEAAGAKRLIDQIAEQVRADAQDGNGPSGSNDRFHNAMLELLDTAKLYILAPTELEHFLYDVSVVVRDTRVVITTDEVDVLAFLKVLLERGARVEVFSAHDFPDAEF